MTDKTLSPASEPATVRELIARLRQGDADAQIAADLLETRERPVPLSAEIIGSLKNDIKEMVRLSDNVGRSRQENCYAMNSAAVAKLVDLEIDVLQRLNALATVSSDAQPVAKCAECNGSGSVSMRTAFGTDSWICGCKSSPAPDVRPSVLSDEQIAQAVREALEASLKYMAEAPYSEFIISPTRVVEDALALLASQPAAPVQQEPVAAQPQSVTPEMARAGYAFIDKHTRESGHDWGSLNPKELFQAMMAAQPVQDKPQEAGQALPDEQIRFRFFKNLNDAQRLAVFNAFGVHPDNCNESLNHGIERRLLDAILKRKPAVQAAPVVSDGREAFEQWAAELAGPFPFDFSFDEFGNYKSRMLFHAFIGWQAAQNRPVGDGHDYQRQNPTAYFHESVVRKIIGNRDALHAALLEVATAKNGTATEAQFARQLQWMAGDAVGLPRNTTIAAAPSAPSAPSVSADAKDVGRLGWLEANPGFRLEKFITWRNGEDEYDGMERSYWQITTNDGRELRGDSIRAAIDAAIAAQSKGEGK